MSRMLAFSLKDNFLNKNSNKYLFSDEIIFNSKKIEIKEQDTFANDNSDDINIKLNIYKVYMWFDIHILYRMFTKIKIITSTKLTTSYS